MMVSVGAKRAKIGLEKIEYNKRECAHVLIQMLNQVLCVFLLAMSSRLQTSFPMSSRKFTCGQVKEQVWGS